MIEFFRDILYGIYWVVTWLFIWAIKIGVVTGFLAYIYSKIRRF